MTRKSRTTTPSQAEELLDLGLPVGTRPEQEAAATPRQDAPKAPPPPPPDPWVEQATAIVRAAWGRQACRREADRAETLERLLAKRPDFPERCQVVAELIRAEAPRLATPGEATAAEYTARLAEPLWRVLPWLDGGTLALLAAELLAAHAKAAPPAVAAPEKALVAEEVAA